MKMVLLFTVNENVFETQDIRWNQGGYHLRKWYLDERFLNGENEGELDAWYKGVPGIFVFW